MHSFFLRKMCNETDLFHVLSTLPLQGSELSLKILLSLSLSLSLSFNYSCIVSYFSILHSFFLSSFYFCIKHSFLFLFCFEILSLSLSLSLSLLNIKIFLPHFLHVAVFIFYSAISPLILHFHSFLLCFFISI